MSDLPEELRDRAARVYAVAHDVSVEELDMVADAAHIRAVAEVLAGHMGCEHLDAPYRRLVVERDDLRARVEQLSTMLRDVLTEAVARSVSPDRQETELREEDLRFEYFDVPDQSVIDESGRGVRLTHTPSGVAVSSGAERTQLQNMAQCIELLRRELAARSVSPDPTTALSGPAGAAHTEEESDA